jgi:hypothetical protein
MKWKKRFYSMEEVMSNLTFFNCEEYIVSELLKVEGVVKLLSRRERASQEGLETTKTHDYVFSLKSSAVLSFSLDEDGYSSICFNYGNEYFYFDSYLEMYDFAGKKRYEEMLEECRNSRDFHFNLTSKLNFFIDYVNNHSELKLVFDGNSWFSIPYDFGGMK